MKTTTATVTRHLSASPDRVYRAWTDPEQFKKWFLAERLIMHQGVDGLFFWETLYQGNVWPHYGRFLDLDEPRVVELTWMSHATQGLESIVRVELVPKDGGTDLTLTHSGLPDEKSRADHQEGWTQIAATLDDLN
jgi:uncharacterized protein YndB with AHSA1/START domain